MRSLCHVGAKLPVFHPSVFPSVLSNIYRIIIIHHGTFQSVSEYITCVFITRGDHVMSYVNISHVAVAD